MSENEESEKEELKLIGRLTGKTTAHKVSVLIEDPEVGKKNYFVIHGAKDEDGERESFLLNITEMWTDSKGVMAKLEVLGERPQRPFEMGSEVYLANEEQITKLLGIYNPPNLSVSLGKLMGYDFNINLLVKNFGRIFITGKSGSGKSYTMGVLCEEFMRKGIPVVIIDRHGEYGSLKVASEDLEDIKKEEDEEQEEASQVYCPWCGKEVDDDATKCEHCGESLELEVPAEGDLEEDMQIKEGPGVSEFVENVIEFGDVTINRAADIDLEFLFSLDAKDIVAPHLCTVINLRGLSLEVQEIVAGKLLKKLYQASTSRQIPPFYLFLDEAHLFAGKKQTQTCEVVKLFAQEGRKFGANMIIGTQRPQLLDTTIRAQAGTWVVHNLSDIRDIGITIQSAEDLSKGHKDDISGLDKGEAIISGEAVKGVPIFIKVRRRRTKHGGVGFDPLEFLSEDTVEELQKRRDRILGRKTEEELEEGKEEFQEIVETRSMPDSLEQIRELRIRNKELEIDLERCKQSHSAGTGGTSEGVVSDSKLMEKVKDLETEVKVWQEKYYYVKDKAESEKEVNQNLMVEVPVTQLSSEADEKIGELSERILFLENEVERWRAQYNDAKALVEKVLAELKKK
jgi:DNA helicase HerA-like ATPase/uncharacterized small protein (DUF1192 family)